MTDTITLPREVVEFLLGEAPLDGLWFGDSHPTVGRMWWRWNLRKALAAEQPKPEPLVWLSRDEARLALWKAINSREFGNPTDDKLILDHLRQQGLWIGKVTSPAPPATHPGYIIGSHWLETAYSRICAGEAEADVLRDIGLVRITDGTVETADIDAIVDHQKALRRDAERFRWLRDNAAGFSGKTLDAAIDAAMEGKR